MGITAYLVREGEMPLAQFPVDALQIRDTAFGGALVYNPYAGLAPTVWHGFALDLDVDLDLDWPEPLDPQTSMSLGALLLPNRWSNFEGSYGPVEDQGESSVYLLNQHVPIERSAHRDRGRPRHASTASAGHGRRFRDAAHGRLQSYEVACGIPPGRSNSERWTARWLLGCDTNLWLSQALLDRIDTGKLDRVAVRSAEDSKHHIRLRQGHTIEELELALAPILPSLEDWLQA